jgi:hypothetical protein
MQNWRVILFPRQRLFLNNYLTTYWNKLVIFNVSTLLTVTYIAVLLLEPEDAIRRRQPPPRSPPYSAVEAKRKLLSGLLMARRRYFIRSGQ